MGWEDPLEKEMATHPSIRAQEIPQIDGIQSAYIQSGWQATVRGITRVGYDLDMT